MAEDEPSPDETLTVFILNEKDEMHARAYIERARNRREAQVGGGDIVSEFSAFKYVIVAQAPETEFSKKNTIFFRGPSPH